MPGFSSPPDPQAYKEKVWGLVRQIPEGRVATYGQIAGLISPPPGMDPKDYLAFSPRWVGGAMAACPADVPWQRVVNSQGKISLPQGAGYEHQRQLLEDEGIRLNDRGRIDLSVFRWEGPEEL